MAQSIIAQLDGPALAFVPLLVAALLGLRYALFAGAALAFVWLFRRRLAPRRLQPVPFTRRQLLREAGWSAVTICVFTGVGIAAYAAHLEWGLFRTYAEIDTHGWVWFWLSIPIGLLIHDFYFYWTHRLMHQPGWYGAAHAVHHRSTNPSPLAAFAFHPLEAVIEIGGFLVVAALLPMHPLALFAMGLVMLAFNVVGHCGYELFPRGAARHPIFGWLNTSTSHNQHHRTFRYNFGLYTLIWDRLFGTLHPNYHKTFAAATSMPKPDAIGQAARPKRRRA